MMDKEIEHDERDRSFPGKQKFPAPAILQDEIKKIIKMVNTDPLKRIEAGVDGLLEIRDCLTAALDAAPSDPGGITKAEYDLQQAEDMHSRFHAEVTKLRDEYKEHSIHPDISPTKQDTYGVVAEALTAALDAAPVRDAGYGPLQHAQVLAQSIADRNYPESKGVWEVGDDIMLVLDQISNMTSGMTCTPPPGIDREKVRELRDWAITLTTGRDPIGSVYTWSVSAHSMHRKLTALLTAAAGSPEPMVPVNIDLNTLREINQLVIACRDTQENEGCKESVIEDFNGISKELIAFIDAAKPQEPASATECSECRCELQPYEVWPMCKACLNKLPSEPMVQVAVVDKALKDAPRFDKRRKPAPGIYVRESNILARIAPHRQQPVFTKVERPPPDADDDMPDQVLEEMQVDAPAPEPVTTEERAEYCIRGEKWPSPQNLARALAGQFDDQVRAWLTERKAGGGDGGE